VEFGIKKKYQNKVRLNAKIGTLVYTISAGFT